MSHAEHRSSRRTRRRPSARPPPAEVAEREVDTGTVEWIGDAVSHLEDNQLARMEALPQAVEQWREHMETLVNYTVLPNGPRSWFLGGNIPGKPQVVLFYFGGAEPDFHHHPTNP